MSLNKKQVSSLLGTDTDKQITPVSNEPVLSLPLTRQVGLAGLKGKYKFDLYPDQNWDDLRALRQSTADKFANGLVKASATAITTALEPLVDLTYGLSRAFKEDRLESIFDNDVTRAFDEFNEGLRETMPHYYTQAEQERTLFGQMVPFTKGSANFWFDKVFSGLGFLAGAAISGNVAGRGAMGLANAVGKLAGVKNLASLSTVAKNSDDAIGALKKITNTVKLNKGTAAAASIISAVGESGIEARHARKDFIDKMKHDRSMGNPNLVGLTDEQIEEDADNVARSTFALNMPTVAGSNFLFLGKYFTGKYIGSAVNEAGRGVARGSFMGGNIAKGANPIVKAKEVSKFKRGLSNVSTVLKVPATEFAQEMTQGVISKASTEYFSRKYDPEAVDFLINATGSTVDALKESFTTKEGLEEGMIGAILGMLQVPGAVKGIKAKTKREAQAIEYLNEYKSSDAFKIREDFTIRDMSIQQEIAEAAEAGDMERVNRLSDDAFFNYVYTRSALGLSELVVEDVKALENMSLEDFSDFIGAKTALTAEQKDKYIKDSEAKVKTIQDAEKLVYTRLPNADPAIKAAFIKNYYDKQAVLNRMEEVENILPIRVRGIREEAHQEFLSKLEAQKNAPEVEIDKELKEGEEKVVNLNEEKETNKVTLQERELTEREKEPVIVAPFTKPFSPKKKIVGDTEVTIGKKVSPIEDSSFEEFNIFRRKIEEEVDKAIALEQDPLKKEELKETKSKLLNLAKQEADTMVLYNQLIKDPEGYLTLQEDTKQLLLKEMFTIKTEDFSGNVVDNVIEKGTYRDSRGRKLEVVDTYINKAGKPSVLVRMNNEYQRLSLDKLEGKRIVKEKKLSKRDKFTLDNLNNIVRLNIKMYSPLRTLETRNEKGDVTSVTEEQEVQSPIDTQDFVLRINEELETNIDSPNFGRNVKNSWTLVSLDGKTKVAVVEKKDGSIGLYNKNVEFEVIDKPQPIEKVIYEKALLDLGKKKRALYDSLETRDSAIKNSKDRLKDFKSKLAYLETRISANEKSKGGRTKVTDKLRSSSLKYLKSDFISLDELKDIRDGIQQAVEEQLKYTKATLEEIKDIEVKKADVAEELEKLRTQWKSNMPIGQIKELRDQYKKIYTAYDQHLKEAEETLAKEEEEFGTLIDSLKKDISNLKRKLTRSLNKLSPEERAEVGSAMKADLDNTINSLVKAKDDSLERLNTAKSVLSELQNTNLDDIANAREKSSHYNKFIRLYENRIIQTRLMLYGNSSSIANRENPSYIPGDVSKGLRPDIQKVGLAKTAGSHTQALENYRKGSRSEKDLKQLRFFNYSQSIKDKEEVEKHRLVFLHKGNIKEYAEAVGDKEIEKIEFYDDTTIIAMVENNKAPVKTKNPGGKTEGYVYTPILLPIYSEDSFTNNQDLTETEIREIEKAHEAFRQSIFRGEVTNRPILTISNGIANSALIAERKTLSSLPEGTKIQIALSDGSLTNSFSHDSMVRPGSSWVNIKGKLRRLESERLGKTSRNNVIAMLVQHARNIQGFDKPGVNFSQKYSKAGGVAIIDYLNSILYFGHNKKVNPDFIIAIDKIGGFLNYGNRNISIEDLAELHLNSELRQELEEFLSTVYVNVSNGYLAKDKYNQVLGNLSKDGTLKFETKRWASYEEFNFSEEQYTLGEDGSEVVAKEPLHYVQGTKKEASLEEPELLSTYFTYDNALKTTAPVETKKPEVKKSKTKRELLSYPEEIGGVMLLNKEHHFKLENQIKDSVFEDKFKTIEDFLSAWVSGEPMKTELVSTEEEFDGVPSDDAVARAIEKVKLKNRQTPNNADEPSLEFIDSKIAEPAKKKKDETKIRTRSPFIEPGFDLTVNRAAKQSKSFILADLPKELKWFKTKFPNIPIELVAGLIENRSYGRFVTNAGVLISDAAIEGTTYHEAFHVISRTLLTTKQREILYNEYRKSEGKELSDFEVEEALAEEFRTFVLSNGDIKATNLRPRQKSFFRRILDWIKGVLGFDKGNFSTLEDTFNNIYNNTFEDLSLLNEKIPESWNLDSEVRNKVSKLAKVYTAYAIEDILDTNPGLLTEIGIERTGPELSLLLEAHLKRANTKINNFNKANHTQEKHKEIVNFIESNSKELVNEILKNFKKFDLFEILEDDNNKSRSMFDDKATISFHKSMPPAIKLLLSSVRDIEMIDFDSNGEPLMYTKEKEGMDAMGLPRLQGYPRVAAILHNSLANIVDEGKMIQELIRIGQTNAGIRNLVSKLGLGVSSVEITKPIFDLQSMFISQMNKAKHDQSITIVDKSGVGSIDAISLNVVSRIKDSWLSNLKTKNLKFVENINNNYTINIDKVLTAYNKGIANAKAGAEFLRQLGIEIKGGDTALSNAILTSFKKLKEAGKTSIFANDLYNSKTMIISNELKETYSRLSTENRQDLEMSYQNADGETVYSILPHHLVSLVVSKLNNNTSSEDIQNSIYTANSQVKNGLKVKIEVLSGLKNTAEGYSSGLSKANKVDIVAIEFGALLDSKIPLLPAGDKKTEKVLVMKGLKTTNEIFLDYLLDEMNLANAFKSYNTKRLLQAKSNDLTKLRILDSMFGKVVKEIPVNPVSYIKKEKIKLEKAINQFFKDKAETYEKNLINLGLAYRENTEGGVVYRVKSMPENLLINKYKAKRSENLILTEDKFKEMMNDAARLYQAGVIEQTKIITGDLALNEKFVKRMSGTISPKNISRNSSDFINNMNKHYERSTGRRDHIFRFIVGDDIMQSGETVQPYIKELIEYAGLSDLEQKVYLNMTITDGISYTTLDGYRDFLLRNKGWSNKHEEIYKKILNKEKLSSQEIVIFSSFKPMGIGNVKIDEGLYVPIYLKTSTLPLIPGYFKEGGALDKLNTYMQENNLDMFIHKSGSKKVIVGDAEGNLENLIDGEFSDSFVHELNWDYIGIQVDSSFQAKDNVKEGSQQDKVFEVNFFGNGSIDTYTDREGNEQNIKEVISELDDFKNELVKRNRAKIYKRFGIKNTGKGLRISKTKELLDFIKDKAEKSEVPSNIIRAVEYTLKGEGSSGIINLVPSKNRIEGILNSIINKSINTEYFGGQNAALPDGGIEKKESPHLKFYTINEISKGLNAMEIMLPNYFKGILGINESIRIEDIPEELLEIYGFRIPTLGPNSIDIMIIKGFLPDSLGNVIVVPEGFTAKTGADFDFDKMFLHYPEFNVVRGKLEYAKFIDYEVDNKEELLRELYSSIYKTSKIKARKELYAKLKKAIKDANLEEAAYINELIKNNATLAEINALKEDIEYAAVLSATLYSGELTVEDFRMLEDEILNLPTITEFLEDNMGKSNIELNTEKAIKNRILKTKKDISLSPERMSDFLRPDNAAVIDEALIYIEDLTGNRENVDSTSYFQLSDFFHNVDVRYKNWAGAGGIGVAAVHNQHHSLAQKADFGINFPEGSINFKGVKYENGYTLANVYDTSTQYGEPPNKISKNISQVLSAFVDNTNDPKVFKLNLNPTTQGVALTLIRFGVDPKTLFAFLNQPILLRYVEEMAKNSYLGKPKKRWQVIEKISREFNIVKGKNIFSRLPTPDITIDRNNLEENIKGTDADFQHRVLQDFLNYKGMASVLSEVTQITGIDRSLAGQDFSHNEYLIYALDQAVGNPIFINAGSLISNTQLREKYNSIKDANEIFMDNKIDKIPVYNDALSIFKNHYFNKGFQYDDISKFLDHYKNGLISYVIQNVKFGGVKLNEQFESIIKGENSIAKKVARFKNTNPELAINNKFLSELASEIADKNEGFDTVKFFNRFMDKDESNILTDSMLELYSLSKEGKTLVNDLIKANFTQSTLGFGPLSMSNLIPQELYLPIIDKWISFYAENNPNFINNFWKSYHQNLRGSGLFRKLPLIESRPSDVIKINRGRQSGFNFAKMYNNKEYYLYQFENTEEDAKGRVKEVWKRIPFKGSPGKFLEGTMSDESILKDNNFVPKNSTSEGVLETDNEDSNEQIQAFIESKIPDKTINVYWGQSESVSSTRMLSNLAPRKFSYQGKDYGSVEHAYQTLKSGSFDQTTYDAYSRVGGYGTKIRGKAVTKGFDNLQLMKDLVVESFKQNSNSEAAKKLLQYNNFTHNTNQIIDKAFLEGLKLAQITILNSPETIAEFKEFVDKNSGIEFPDSAKLSKSSSIVNEVRETMIEDGLVIKVGNRLVYEGESYTMEDFTSLLEAGELPEVQLPELLDESENAYTKLLSFLEKIGVSVKLVDFIRNRKGEVIDAKGIAKLFSNTIELVKGVANTETLGEEAFHFYTKLLEVNTNNQEAQELLSEMMNNIDQFEVFQEVKEEYSELDDYGQRMEAVGKLLAKIAMGENIDNLKLDNQAKGWFNKVIQFIKNFFANKSDQGYIKAVNQVMEGDLSLLELNKVGLTGEMLSKNSSQLIREKLLEDNNLLTKKMVGGRERYFYKGREVKYRVHDILNLEKAKRGFDEYNPSESDLKRREYGVNTHADIENILKRKIESIKNINITQRTVKTNDESYGKLKYYYDNLIDGILEKYPGAEFFVEQQIIDKKGEVAGTIDLLVITSEGRALIYDHKTIGLQSNKDGEIIQEIPGLKLEDWNTQARKYKNILSENYGIKKFGAMRMIPIKLDIKSKEKGYAFSRLKIDDPALVQQSVAEELVEDESTNRILDRLRKRLDAVKVKQPSTSAEKEIRAERIRSLSRAINSLIVKQDALDFINSGKVEIIRAEDKGLENMTAGELTDLEKTLKFYREISEHGKFSNLTNNSKEQRSLIELNGRISSLFTQLNQIQETTQLEEIKSETRIKTVGSAHVPINWTTEVLKTISQSTVPEIRALYRYIVKAQDNIRVAMNATREDVGDMVKNLEDWASKKGMGMYDLLIAKDENGNPTGKIISPIDKEYWKIKDKKVEEEDWKWVQENTNFDKEKYDKVIEEKKEVWASYYAAEDDGAKKLENRIKTYEYKYNVLKHPKTAYLSNNWFLEPKKMWESKEYKRLFEAENKPVLKFYEYYQDKLEEFREFIPKSERGNLLGRNYIVPIKKSAFSRFTSMFGATSNVNLIELADAITLEGDSDNLPKDPTDKSIPLPFIKPVDSKMAAKMNYDLAYSLQVMSASAYNYKYMQQIEDSTQVLKRILENKDQVVVNRGGDPIINSGRVSVDKMNPENNRSLNQYTDFMNYYLYGVTRKDNKLKIKFNEGTKEFIKKNLGKEINGVDLSKGLDTAKSYYSLTVLVLNSVSGIANFANGIANFIMEASKGGMFSRRDALGSIVDITKGEGKVWDIMSDLDILGKNEGMRGALNSKKGFWSKIFNLDNMYILQQMGDTSVQNATLISMMKSHTIVDGKLVKRKKGDKTFLELIEKTSNGKLDYKVSNQELQDFRRKSQAISETALGIASRDDMRTAGLGIMTRMLLQFRSWMPKMGYARFGDLNYNSEIGRWEAGRYRQFFNDMVTTRVIGNITQMISGMGTSLEKSAEIKYYELLAKYNPEANTDTDLLVNPDTGEVISLEEYTDMYLQNTRAMGMEIAMITSLIGLIALVKAGDDEDKEGWRRVVLKSLNRLENELKFFYDVDSFLAVVRSPIPIVNAFQQAKRTLGSAFTDTAIWFDWQDGEYEFFDNLIKMLPIISQVERTTDLLTEPLKSSEK